MSRIELNAVGVASNYSFVMELLPAINQILNQKHVLGKYAQVLGRSIKEIKMALETPPGIRFSTVPAFNAFLSPGNQINSEKTNGWYFAVRDYAGIDWSNFLNVNQRYFPSNVDTLNKAAKRNHQVFFTCIVLHQLTHWLEFKLKANGPDQINRENGAVLEMILLGGTMCQFYHDHGDHFKIDGLILQFPGQSLCRQLSQDYFKYFFQDMEKLKEQLEAMCWDLNLKLPNGASLKAPVCGCEAKGNYPGMEIDHDPMEDY